jgi:hypothetical protein
MGCGQSWAADEEAREDYEAHLAKIVAKKPEHWLKQQKLVDELLRRLRGTAQTEDVFGYIKDVRKTLVL